MPDVGDTVRISAAFEVGGVLTDPATVDVRWRKPDGTVTSPVSASNESVGVWGYDLTLDQAGTWRYEFVGTGTAAGTQGGVLRVAASLIDQPGALTLVSPDDVRDSLRRELSDVEYDAALVLIPRLTRLLERKLNRDLVGRSYATETHRIPNPSRPVYPNHNPVDTITAVTVDGTAVTAPWPTYDWYSADWAAGSLVAYSYTTRGVDEDSDSVDDAQDVRGVIADAVGKTLLLAAPIATGAIKSYSVEGTSITYGDGGAGTEAGRITVGDMSGIGRLKWPVLL